MERWLKFEQCPHCAFDFWSGEGERECRLGECAYLPTELDVYCPDCRFNFAAMEGNPPCDDPATCERAGEARANVENLRAWEKAHHQAAT